MNNWISTLDRLLKLILVLLMVALVLDVCWQVITRFVLADPSSFTEELARFLLIWISMLGAALCFSQRAHLSIDYFVDQFSEGNQRRVFYLVGVLTLMFAFLALLVGGGFLVMFTYQLDQYSAALGVKIAFVYAVVPLTGGLISIFTLAALVAGPVPVND